MAGFVEFQIDFIFQVPQLSVNSLQISRYPIGICSLLHCPFLLTIHNKDPISVDSIEFVLLGYDMKLSSLSSTESVFTNLSIFYIKLTLAQDSEFLRFSLSIPYRLRPDLSTSETKQLPPRTQITRISHDLYLT